MVAFQIFIQLICSLIRLPASASASASATALELTTAPAPALELTTASTSLQTTTVVKSVAGKAICKVTDQKRSKQKKLYYLENIFFSVYESTRERCAAIKTISLLSSLLFVKCPSPQLNMHILTLENVIKLMCIQYICTVQNMFSSHKKQEIAHYLISD